MAKYEVLISFIVFVQFSVVRCGIWNDIFHIEEDLPLIWNNRLTTQNKCFSKLPDNSLVEGVCKTHTDCLLTKGVPRGHCGLLSTCCTYERSCGRSSNSKISYFTSGFNQLQREDPCSFNVIRANERVCQIRLDFIEFHIAPPLLTKTSGTSGSSLGPDSETYQCSQDNFYITPTTGLPEICGHNTGQHMYIPVSDNSPNIKLNFRIASNNTEYGRWNIKVTQLECPGKHYLLGALDKDVVKDFDLLAPIGCLQYFTKRSDFVMSFAYDIHRESDQRIVSNQKYSICIKRPENTCRVEYIFDYFTIESDQCSESIVTTSTTSTTTGMTTPLYLRASECAKNYVEITGTNSAIDSKICGTHANGYIVTVTPPGPLHVDFYTETVTCKGGFKLKYDIKSC